jgi:hypothetical protein
MNEVLKAARAKGMLIIHCPGDTLGFYQDHPGRKLAQAAPKVASSAQPTSLKPSHRSANHEPARR